MDYSNSLKNEYINDMICCIGLIFIFEIADYNLSLSIFILAEEEKPTMNEGGDEETVVRVRGLPWSATVEDILKFFGKFSLIFSSFFLSNYTTALFSMK